MSMHLTSEESLSLNEYHRNIGLNIHKARAKRKITIEKLSQISGLRTQTIERYEMGTHNISFVVLMKLASILKVGIDEFLVWN